MNRVFNARRIPLFTSALAVWCVTLGAGCNKTIEPPAGTPVLTLDFPRQEFTSNCQGFDVSFRLDRTRYRPGEEATLTMVVRNVSTRVIGFSHTAGRHRYDFAVRDSSDQAIWRWSEGQPFGGTGQESVGPGDSLVIAEQSWNLLDRSGAALTSGASYSIVAEPLGYASTLIITYPHLEFTAHMVP